MTEKNIFQRMAEITAELQTVAKNMEVKAGGGTYKAVSERDIIDAVKPAEIAHGVYSYPCDREIVETEILESENEYNGKITRKTTFFSRIKTTYRFVNIDDPEDYIETVTFSEGIDAQDKGSGKAMTYADKYALMKAYKISTGDDPDQTASTETSYSSYGNRRGGYSAPAPEPAPAHSYREPEKFVCADCGNVLKPYKMPDGKMLAVRAIADRNSAKYGRVLCAECATIAAAKMKQEETANVE